MLKTPSSTINLSLSSLSLQKGRPGDIAPHSDVVYTDNKHNCRETRSLITHHYLSQNAFVKSHSVTQNQSILAASVR